MAEEKELKKAAPFSPYGAEVGQPGFITASGWVKDQREAALSPPHRWTTYRDMANDSCVGEGLSATQTLIFLALYGGRWQASEEGTALSKKYAEVLNHNFLNMEHTSWADACQGFVTHVQDGLSLNEVVAEKAKTGPYAGSYQLSKIGHRLADSIYGFIWDSKERDVQKVVHHPLRVLTQLKTAKRSSSYLESITNILQFQDPKSVFYNYPVVDIRKMVHMRYKPEGSNPLGRSPMNQAWAAWQQKIVIDQYQLIGITRDFGGIPVFRAPSDLYTKAQDPHNNPHDYKALQDMRHQLANLHAGREAFIMLSSDVYDGSNTPEYDIKFLGVEGSGKQFDTSAIIASKNAEIYSAFNASYLNMGKDGKTGSYNLSTTGFNIHAFVLEKEIIHCVSELQKLGKRILQANGVEPSYRDMPRFIPADPDQLSPDEFGKLIQRLGSVEKLTPQMLKHFTKLAGCDIEGIDELDFTSKGDTKAGTGMGTSGQGSNPQSNSDTNMNNKALNLIEDEYGNGQKALIHADGPNAGKLFKIEGELE